LTRLNGLSSVLFVCSTQIFVATVKGDKLEP